MRASANCWEGLLKNTSQAKPDTVHADTQGQSGVAVAATVLPSNTTIASAALGVTCYAGTPQSDKSELMDMPLEGRTPQAACAQMLHVPTSSLVVCTSPGPMLAVAVWERGSDPADECAAAHMTPGVPAGYQQAVAATQKLRADLNQLYASRSCFTTAGLEAGTEAVLRKLDFTGWRVATFHTVFPHGDQSGSTGPCAQYFGMTGTRISIHNAMAQAPNTIVLQGGPSHPVMGLLRRLNTMSAKLMAAPPNATARCTVARVERYITTTLRGAGAPGPILYAIYNEKEQVQGGVMQPTLNADDRQDRYQAGCPVFAALQIAPNGTTVEVLLLQKSAPIQPNGGQIPSSAYKPPAAG